MAGRHRARSEDRTATYAEVFAVAEFRGLWSAHVLSLVGDQLARVALSVLVFERTNSALLTAVTYALTYLPWLIAGPLLSGLADRLPRRGIMVACDLARALLVGLMALPGVPVLGLFVLLFVAECLSPPFNAARAATVPDVLEGDRYIVGSAVTNITIQGAQVLGFAVGGVAVTLLGTRLSLALDAATFAVSALVIRCTVRPRPIATDDEAAPRGSLLTGLYDGVRLVFSDRWLRTLVLLAWLCTFYVVPEGLAAPYAARLGGGPTMVGLLLAANPVGVVVGAFLLGRLVRPSQRPRLLGPLALLSCAPLVACAASPGAIISWLLWALSGVGAAYSVIANAAFVRAVPAACRGQAFGVAQTGIAAGQGLGIVAAGAVATVLSPTLVIAVFGAAGLAAATVLMTSAATVQRRIEPPPITPPLATRVPVAAHQG